VQKSDSVTCLSTASHGPEAARDLLQHYTGCIEINKRGEFLDKDSDFWQKAKTELGGDSPDAEIKNIINSLAVSIEAQYKRTDVLRNALKKEAKGLVECVNDSGKAWRQCQEFRSGIEKVRKWRRDKNMHTDDDGVEDDREKVQEIVREVRGKEYLEEVEGGVKDYELERDVNAYLIQSVSSHFPLSHYAYFAWMLNLTILLQIHPKYGRGEQDGRAKQDGRGKQNCERDNRS
jgi:hypothetical protein